MQSIDDFHFELISSPEPLERSAEWGKQSSREALAGCLKKMGINSKSSEDLTIIGHTHLAKHPQITASISHTRKVGAALTSNRDQYPSVGIDIEFVDRKIAHGAEKYFINEDDGVEVWQNILLTWTLKEAAFKALSPYIDKFDWPKVLVLKDIWIKKNQFGLRGNTKILGKTSSRIKKAGELEMIISFAFLNPLL
ncbi:MAG: hypothetical protein DRQ88_03415 [Epsilonproteobacteria bacterium]|nr:MAG: hypothetical protein DRQ89_01345 [Campylobacterota bacterium]RLA67368.1 MAG: hypothetical protein DRQ88_03415 [Campylobacterota bacterium]